MMGPRQIAQGQLSYDFSLEAMVPADHLLRSLDHFVDLSSVRPLLAPSYSSTGRPSVDPELMIRMLLVGYCYGIRSERRLCEEVGLNLAYRWFCRLDLTDPVPDHSTFSKNRYGRFRDYDLLRQVFETVLARCIVEGLVGGRLFGADASLIKADASRYNKMQTEHWSAGESASRAVQEYLDTLDDAAFGGATTVQPKTLSPSDPAARFTGANGDRPFFAYSTNYLVDLEHAIIVDVEATAPVRQAEVGSVRNMILRTEDTFGLHPETLVADTAYGAGEMLGWLVDEQGIDPHIPVFDKTERSDGAFPATAFSFDPEAVPPLHGSNFAKAGPEVVAQIMQCGIDGPIRVKGFTCDSHMPGFAGAPDVGEVSQFASYVAGRLGGAGAVPLAALGVIGPALAAAAMLASSVSGVLNRPRLHEAVAGEQPVSPLRRTSRLLPGTTETLEKS